MPCRTKGTWPSERRSSLISAVFAALRLLPVNRNNSIVGVPGVTP